MKSHLKIASSGAAILALAITFALGRSSPPVIAAEPEPTFVDTWREAALPLALKAATLEPSFRVVQTEKVIPPVIPAPEPYVRTIKPKGKPKDVCQRHGMRKVQRGRSWRCRR